MKSISVFLVMLMFIVTGCFDVKKTNNSQSNSSEYLQVTTASTSNQLNPDGTINSTNGTSGALYIAINKYVVLNFSDTINPTTVNASSVYILDANQIPIVSELIVSGNTISVIPIELFLPNQTYTIVVTTTVQDVSGRTLKNTFTFTFFTVDESVIPEDDLTAPSLNNLTPTNGSIVNKTTNIVMSFDESITGAGILTLRDTTLNNDVVGASSISGNMLNFTPTSALVSGNDYTVTLQNSVGDLSGNVYSGLTSWSFSVTVALELKVTEVAQAGRTIRVFFSEELNASTVLASEFLINAGAINFGQFGLSSSDATVVKFVATEDINSSDDVTVSGNVKDIFGVNHNGGVSDTYTIGYILP